MQFSRSVAVEAARKKKREALNKRLPECTI